MAAVAAVAVAPDITEIHEREIQLTGMEISIPHKPIYSRRWLMYIRRQQGFNQDISVVE